jgi:hypothetical protein
MQKEICREERVHRRDLLSEAMAAARSTGGGRSGSFEEAGIWRSGGRLGDFGMRHGVLAKHFAFNRYLDTKVPAQYPFFVKMLIKTIFVAWHTPEHPPNRTPSGVGYLKTVWPEFVQDLSAKLGCSTGGKPFHCLSQRTISGAIMVCAVLVGDNTIDIPNSVFPENEVQYFFGPLPFWLQRPGAP